MIPEEAMRRLQAVNEGTDPRPELVFLGETYEVITEGRLAAVLRYAGTGQPSAPERARLESLGDLDAVEAQGGDQAMLAAAHQLLEECLADFRGFSAAAWSGKVTVEQVREAVMRVIEVITARPPMAALRLLRYVTGSLAEFDGALLLAGGRGLASMTAREACNAAYTRCLESVEPDRRAEWREDLYLDYNPEDQALEMVRQMQAAREAEADGGHD